MTHKEITYDTAPLLILLTSRANLQEGEGEGVVRGRGNAEGEVLPCWGEGEVLPCWGEGGQEGERFRGHHLPLPVAAAHRYPGLSSQALQSLEEEGPH